MERFASRTFCLLLLVFTGLKGQQSQCEDGWFGNKCQYQCHCLSNTVCDKTTGECPGACDRRWFGPQCQYWDAAYSTNGTALTDGDDSTCLSPYGGLSQVFSMSDNVMFTWMRLVTKIDPYVRSLYIFDHVNITFLSSSGTVVAPKSRMTRIYLSDSILEIYGELQDRLNKIRLDFDSVETKQSFCSMQVSTGRNVAVKQHASQSSNNKYAFATAEKAVDGRSNQWFFDQSCTGTDIEDSSFWTMNLSLPVTVNMYTLLSTKENWGICKLRYFRLKSYFESNEVQQYDETGTVNKVSYDVYSVNASPITSVTLTVSKDFWPNNSYDCDVGKPSLMFCEMQIYGDVMCTQGKWGRDCENNCNCQDPSDSCYVSTGMCPSGCKAGFRGPGCLEVCIHNTYGDGCNKTCNVNCVRNATQEPAICEHVTGKCLLGCKSSYSGITCEERPSDEVKLEIIIVPIVYVLFGVAAVIIGILFWRRKKAQQDGKEAVAEDGTISGSNGAEGHGDHQELRNQPTNRQDPVNDNYDQISLHSNENPPDSNENENMRTDENEENAANNEYDQTRPYVNVDNTSMHEYEKMRSSMNEENTSMREYEKMRSSMNEENTSMHEYEKMRSSMTEENPDVNVYDKISPCTNVDNSPVKNFEDVGANIRELKTDADISETEGHVYSEPEPGF